MDDDILFADTEGNDFYPAITKMWTIQLGWGTEGKVEVYADQPGYRPIAEALKIMKKARKVVFHNTFGFDFWAVNKLYPGTLRQSQMIDTLIISRLMDSTAKRHALKDMGEALGFPKGDHSDFSQFSEEMAIYGAQDVRILQAAWKGSSPNGKRSIRPFGQFYHTYQRACELEFKTAYVIAKQTHHGFRFDYEGAQMLEAEFRQEYMDKERELQVIFPPLVIERYSEKQIDKKTGKPKRLKDKVEVFNPGSNPQIEERLKAKYKWKPSKKTPNGQAKIDETILEELPYPEAKEIARYKHLGKKLGMIADGKNAWLKMAEDRPNGDFYIHGQINTLGARTHRMSHFKPNVAQADGDSRMRKLWLPDPGHVLVGVDAEGLELRELAHFLFPYDNGFYAKTVHEGKKEDETDIHNVNKRAAKLYLRDSAKTMIYAHNYGCFDKKLGQIVVDDAREAGKPIPEGSLTSIGEALRKNIASGIQGLGELISKCQRQHKKKAAMLGHDGRYIPSASEHSALNTLLQGNGSIVMKEALNVFDDEMEKLQLMDKFHYCANVHDEFQLSVEPDFAEKVAETGKWAITQAGLNLEVRCPLVGSADIGKSWADTH